MDALTHPAPNVGDTSSPGADDRARRLALRATTTAVVADLALMALIGEAIVPLLVFAGLTVAAVLTLRQHRTRLVVALGVLAVAELAGGGAIAGYHLRHPAEVASFLWAILSGGGRVVAIAAAVLVVRGREALAPAVARVGLAVLALAVVVTGVARASVRSDVAEPGDVTVVAERSAYPSAVTVERGQTLFVDNRDEWGHSFTIEDTDVDVDLPPTADRRVAIDLAPGTYLVRCTVPGHDTMTTTLEVR